MIRINAYHPAGHIRGVTVTGDPAKAMKVMRAMVSGWPVFRIAVRCAR